MSDAYLDVSRKRFCFLYWISGTYSALRIHYHQTSFRHWSDTWFVTGISQQQHHEFEQSEYKTACRSIAFAAAARQPFFLFHTWSTLATSRLLADVMKGFLVAALASLASAHYVFPSVIEKGVATPPWQDVRQYTTYYTFNGVTDVTSLDIRCNVNGSTISSNTTTVNAGDTIGFTVNPSISHPGPALVYMAKAPTGTNVATWDGSGSVWFKIWQEGPSSFNDQGPVWPTTGMTGALYAEWFRNMSDL